MRLNLLWILILSTSITFSCSKKQFPDIPFADSPQAPTPDYSLNSSWSALPDMKDEADKVPPGVGPENQKNASVDVFFIHPTTYMKGKEWNSDINDPEINESTDTRPIRYQASAFNASCRVYAPRYRQMRFAGFFSNDSTEIKEEIKALDFAYQDVQAAFDFYLENYNNGRPIVIAAHSQGAFHGIQLVQDFFDGEELQDQLVAAYLIGWPFPVDSFAVLPPCNSPTQTGCVIGWCSWKKGVIPDNFDTFYKGAVVTNPLSWETNEKYVSKEKHLGYLKADFKTIKAQEIDAQAHGGILWVKSPAPIVPIKNFHIGDINLFWLDIRKNVAERVDSYLKSHPEASK